MEKHLYLYAYISIFILSSCFTSCISSPSLLNNSDSRTEYIQIQLQVNNKTKEEFYAKKISIPSASVEVSLKKLNWKGATFELDILITSPLPVPVPVFDLSYTLKSDNRVIASGTVSDPDSLKANDVTKLTALVDIPFNILISLIKDISKDWDIDYEIDVEITVNLAGVGKITIPFSKTGTIKLPKP